MIITPQAWVPTFLTEPSRILAWVIVSASKSSPSEIFKSWLTLSKSSGLNSDLSLFVSVSNIVFNLDMLGINLASLSASFNGKSKTLAVSLMDDFAAIVPYVIIWATCVSPYLFIT